jgi:hypothetical protein
MVESGDWITPTLNGVPRFAKPILLYWLISGAYLTFGVSEFTARLPSAAFATALIVMQYLFARRILGPVPGLRAALMLLLNFEILGIGRMVLTDMVLVFFTTLSIFSFFLAMWGVGAGGARVPVAPSNATGDGPPPAPIVATEQPRSRRHCKAVLRPDWSLQTTTSRETRPWVRRRMHTR